MSRFKDTGNIAKTVQELTGQKPNLVDSKESMNYIMPTMQRLYNLLQPAMTTVETNNVLFFNSSELIADNAYPIQLIDYYHNASATFSNFINLRRNMLIGNGLQPVNQNGTGNTATIEFINKSNDFGESLQDIWSKLCFDFSLFESYFLELLYNPSNGKIDSVIHQSPDVVRAVANENPNIPYVKTWQLSRNWGTTNKVGKNRTVYQGIPIANYNPYNWSNDGARQLMACKRYSAGNEVYAIPSFNSILAYVELDAQLAKYDLNSVTKGFTPQTIVVLAGNPDKKTKDEFVNKFKMKYTGADAERILFIWSVDESTKPQILPFQNADVTPMLELLDKICVQKIASGMGGNLELAGIQSTGGQSLQADANKIAVSYNFYYMTTILPMQKQMLESLNKIMTLNGLEKLTVVTPPLQFDIPSAQPAAVPK